MVLSLYGASSFTRSSNSWTGIRIAPSRCPVSLLNSCGIRTSSSTTEESAAAICCASSGVSAAMLPAPKRNQPRRRTAATAIRAIGVFDASRSIDATSSSATAPAAKIFRRLSARPRKGYTAHRDIGRRDQPCVFRRSAFWTDNVLDHFTDLVKDVVCLAAIGTLIVKDRHGTLLR